MHERLHNGNVILCNSFPTAFIARSAVTINTVNAQHTAHTAHQQGAHHTTTTPCSQHAHRLPIGRDAQYAMGTDHCKKKKLAPCAM